jgi:Flp pilus assembly pilin Flp
MTSASQNLKLIILVLRYFFREKKAGSMIESGLLIALSLILFLMLIAIVTDLYGWIEGKFNDVIKFFDPIQ